MSLGEVRLQSHHSFLFKPFPLCKFQSSLNKLSFPTRRIQRCRTQCSASVPPHIELSISNEFPQPLADPMHSSVYELVQNMVLLDLDPATAKVAIAFLGPFLSAFGFLFILRIVMSWYPKLPVGKFPYVLAYAPTEPILVPTRKVIPPLGGVDVTPVVWFALISFLNEILVGPQGLLVLLSQQQV